MEVVEFAVGTDSRGYVEVPDEASGNGGGGLAGAGAGVRIVRAAADTWQGALAGLRSAAEGASAQLRAIDPPPEEVEVTFGVTVDGKLGATLVSAGTNTHVNVKVVWRNAAGAASAVTAGGAEAAVEAPVGRPDGDSVRAPHVRGDQWRRSRRCTPPSMVPT